MGRSSKKSSSKKKALGPSSNSNNGSPHRIRAMSFGRNYFYQRGMLLRSDPHSENDQKSAQRREGVGGADEDEDGPWNDQQQQLPRGAVCTAQSTVLLTAQGHVFQTGTLHGRVLREWTRITYPLPLQCVQVSAGRHFVVARLEGGQAVVTWGAGHFGQLGVTEQRREYYGGDGGGGDDSTITTTAMVHAPEPVLVQRLLPSVTGSPIRQVAAGDWHCLALTESGTVWCWGSNRSLQCGIKHSNNSHHGGSTVALPCPLTTLPEIIQIAAGRSHSVALAKMNHSNRNTGTATATSTADPQQQPSLPPHQHQLYAWGASQHGQCGTGITTRRGVPGLMPASIDTLPPGLELIQIAASGHHTLALSKAGRVFAWGDGREGQLGLSLAAGSNNSNNNGTTTTNNIAQLQTSKPRLVADLDFVAVAAGQEWKLQQQQQQQSGHSVSAAETLASIPKIVSLHAAASYSAALSSSGHVYCWGSNDVGQLGVPTPPPQQLPWCDGSVDLARGLHQHNPDGTAESMSTTTKTEPLARPLHARNFDSNHNVLLPVRVQKVDHIYVSLLALGPNHMWCFGEERPPDAQVVVGRTLHEVQEEQRLKRLSDLALSNKPQPLAFSSDDYTPAVESDETQATLPMAPKPTLSIFENDVGVVQQEAAVLLQNDNPPPADVLNAGTVSPVPSSSMIAEVTLAINTTNTSGSSGSTSEEESQTTSAVLEPSDSFFDPSATENNDDSAARDFDEQKNIPMVAAVTATTDAAVTSSMTTEAASTTTRQKRPGVLKRLSSKLLRRRSSHSMGSTSGGGGGISQHSDHAGRDGSESTAGFTATPPSRRRGGLRGLQDILAGGKRS